METRKSLDVNFGEHLRTSNGDVHGKFIWDFKGITEDVNLVNFFLYPIENENQEFISNNSGGWKKVHYVHQVHLRQERRIHG